MVQPRSLNICCFLGHFLLLINPGLVVQAINFPLQSAPFIFSSGLKITGSECLKSSLLHFLQFWLITSILFLSGKLPDRTAWELEGREEWGKRDPKDMPK